ncbi:MAG: hypothetical protein A2066_17965 [Bacteroidetes bacterium GWB2_41_8]|nr:MAG: hypothetical protein A2066_17965 [Bacteroidetes bacterium GWB2_41_8]
MSQNLGKGPPGKFRSPGIGKILFPDHPPDAEKRKTFFCQTGCPMKHISNFTSDFQYFNKSTITNFNNYLNFIIMKKQILTLVFLVLATFAGTTVFGQALPGSAPRPLVGCDDDALHPIAGKPYNYVLDATPSGGTYTWWATTDDEFITTSGTTTSTNLATHLLSPTTATAGTDLTATGTNYATTGASNTVSITWGSTILANTTYDTAPTFVVGYYTAPATDCADNIKVYQIDPKNGFTVDIRNIDMENATTPILAYDAADDQCIDLVRNATFAAGAMSYNYGTNYFYYEVVAANFSEEWTPEFTFTGHNAVQTPTIEWTYSAPADFATATWNAATTKVTTNETNTSTGVSIYVRVTLENNNYEGTASTPVVLAVAGTNKDGLLDVNNVDCTQPATAAAAAADDTATQTLEPRPALTPGTTSTITPNTTIITGNNVN